MNATRASRTAILCTLTIGLAAESSPYDIVIGGGRIVDGSGNPWFAGDVAVRGGRIAAAGRVGDARGARLIDAAGSVVAPGFIDLHTHSDLSRSPRI
jgi:N-acyl-D-amino-acid deacylase